MSKLNDLINKRCPNGVPYRKLGEIEKDGLIKLGRGKVISKRDIANNPGTYPIYSASAMNNGKFGEYGDYMFDDIRLTWSIDGGGRFFYRDDEKYSVTNVCGWLKVLDENAFNPKFLFYVLTSQWSKLVFNYTIKAHPSVIRNTYDIPMVPLPVQSEIVRILDSFTELEAELEAELAGRREQYEYYRDYLLDKKNLESMDGKPVETKPMWAITTWDKKFNGVDKKKQPAINRHHYYLAKELEPLIVPDGDIKVLTTSPSDLYTTAELAKNNIKDGEIVAIPWGGNAIVQYYNGKYITSDNRIAIVNDEEQLNCKFLFYVLKNREKELAKYYRGAGIKHPNMFKVLHMEIPVPSLATQKRVVDILDRFDALTTSLTDGIPAEIEMRREQYEYYRSRLLDFPRLPEDSDSDDE